MIGSVVGTGSPIQPIVISSDGNISLSDGTLTVNGSSGNDTILVQLDPSDAKQLDVTLNGTQKTFNVDDVQHIALLGNAGDDSLTISDANGQVGATHYLDGGDGNDYLHGDAAIDTLVGGNGLDHYDISANGDYWDSPVDGSIVFVTQDEAYGPPQVGVVSLGTGVGSVSTTAVAGGSIGTAYGSGAQVSGGSLELAGGSAGTAYGSGAQVSGGGLLLGTGAGSLLINSASNSPLTGATLITGYPILGAGRLGVITPGTSPVTNVGLGSAVPTSQGATPPADPNAASSQPGTAT
jgi:hypothetical protein